jgi:hypothetical protein
MIKLLSRWLSAVLIVSTLAGCFAPRTEWVKEGATEEELRYARLSCERESSGYTFVDEDFRSRDTRDRGPASARSDVYRRCMESQGWRRQRTDQPRADQAK